MFLFNRNIGKAERIVRFIIGVIFLIIPLILWSDMPIWLIVALSIGGIGLIVQGLLKWCPLKAFFGLGQCYHENHNRQFSANSSDSVEFF